MGDGVTYIGRLAFYGDISLKSISLPSATSLVGEYIFKPNEGEQMKMAKVTFRSGDAGNVTFSPLFDYIPQQCRFIVPKGTKESFLQNGFKNVEEY